MTLLRYDGFDHYSTAQMTPSGQWTSLVQNSSTISIAAVGRSSTNGLRISRGGGGLVDGHARATLTNVVGTGGTVGIAVTLSNVANNGPKGFWAVEDSASPQLTIAYNATGQIVVTRGSKTGTVLGTTNNTYAAGSTHYIEFQWIIHPSTGMVDLHVDNVQVDIISGGSPINGLTNQNTRSTANTSWNGYDFQLVYSDFGGAVNVDFDDFYLLDNVDATATQKSAFNTFLGDLIVKTIYPTSDGNYLQFTPSSSAPTTHFSFVDETPPTDDTDYVASATVGNRDSFNYVLPIGTVKALQPTLYARKDDAGTRKVTPFTRISSVDYDNSDLTLSTSYQLLNTILTFDPASSSNWSSGTTKEFGIKVTV